jgi:hypothetical protein
MFRLLLVAVLLLGAEAHAQGRPRALGEFQAWTAATHTENGEKVCYAFARARSVDGVAGRAAESAMLLVTHRAQGRDQVAVRPGFAFARGAEARLVVGQAELPFFTANDTAFARDGRAVIAALRGGREAQFRAPGPNNRGQANDAYPLQGFTAAYDAISRECPAPRR